MNEVDGQNQQPGEGNSALEKSRPFTVETSESSDDLSSEPKNMTVGKEEIISLVDHSSTAGDRGRFSSQTPGTTLSMLVPPHIAYQVIKGEIHNLLTLLRADSRYASADRFEREQNDDHEAITALINLSTRLSHSHSREIPTKLPLASVYLKPFLKVITTREISALVTGAALNAVQKFVLYGFLLPGYDAENGLEMVAQALLHCTFEETEAPRGRSLRKVSSSVGSTNSNSSGGGGTSVILSRRGRPDDDECVVLRLLDLAALVVRSGVPHQLVTPKSVVGLLETCWHVSHKASTAPVLLQSAAHTSLSQIVLQVFSGRSEYLLEARYQVLSELAQLLNPLTHDEVVTVSTLQALNMALETLDDVTDREVTVLQTSVCKHLLQWSTSQDLVILTLTLRVIFNLLRVQEHLKVPLEVFVTSVHLRLVDNPGAADSHREAALESLLEFCQEPALMRDLYRNYDCDVMCTNLFQSVVSTLGRAAKPETIKDLENGGAEPSVDFAPPPTLLNRLSMDCLLAVLDSIESRCEGDLHLESVAKASDPKENLNGVDSELVDRKKRKHALMRVAESFNKDSTSEDWKILAVEQGILESATNEEAVARLLYTTPGLDKAEMGVYLSKGPNEDYPFVCQVRQHFIRLYDFRDLPFASALRRFLSKFRLPGEAQCIDRFMESFSKTLCEQQGESSIFKDADAIYVLSFSTIMLNTDLHNPTIKEENRMTCQQFLRNNRGINGGDDLPDDFLQTLYKQIKEDQIQVNRDLGEIIKNENDDVRTAWESILAKGAEVAAPCFTPIYAKREKASSDTHDKAMFTDLTKWILYSFPDTFERSLDNGTVLKALRGLQKAAKLAAYFEMDETLDQIVSFLLAQGREYVAECVELDGEMAADGTFSQEGNGRGATEHIEDDETTTNDGEDPVPYGHLSSTSTPSDSDDVWGVATHRGLLALDSGLALVADHSRRIANAWAVFVECMCVLRDAKALPTDISALDDFADSNGNALPPSPFAVRSKRKIEEYYRAKLDLEGSGKKKGWFRGLFKNSKSSEEEYVAGDERSVSSKQGEALFHASILRKIVESTGVENVVQIGPSNQSYAAQVVSALLTPVESYPYEGNPVGEQCAVYSLELATRTLLSSRDNSLELFTLVLKSFEGILSGVSEKSVPAPFIIERMVVTILRASIHLYDQEELRPHLRASLHLVLMSLPRSFLRQIADRMACGLAIILRASYHYFETANDWTFLGDTLDMLAAHSMSRVFVFDGIASTLEHAIPDLDEDGGDRPSLSMEACKALAKILTRFVLGFYQRDTSLQVPAMLCLEKLYRHKVLLLLGDKSTDQESYDATTLVPDEEMWQNSAVAVYAVCRSPDVEVSHRGVECFQRLILACRTDSVPEDKWIAILYLMLNKQPSFTADASRGNTFALVGQVLSKVLPVLTHSAENRDDLIDLIHMTTTLAEDNLRQGRRGSVSPLFEKTLQTVTYLSNSMVADEWGGEPEFSGWASECLLYELEKIGAAGASTHNQVATRKVASEPPASPPKDTRRHSSEAARSTPKTAPLSYPDDPSENDESADVSLIGGEKDQDPAKDETAIESTPDSEAESKGVELEHVGS